MATGGPTSPPTRTTSSTPGSRRCAGSGTPVTRASTRSWCGGASTPTRRRPAWTVLAPGDGDLMTDAPPIYLQEKIDPRVLVEDLRRAAARPEDEPELTLRLQLAGVGRERDVKDGKMEDAVPRGRADQGVPGHLGSWGSTRTCRPCATGSSSPATC